MHMAWRQLCFLSAALVAPAAKQPAICHACLPFRGVLNFSVHAWPDLLTPFGTQIPSARLPRPLYTPLCLLPPGESLRQLRAAVGNEAAVLGFVGAPFTLATYIVEGGSSKNFANIKRLAFGQPEVLHALLDKLADNVTDYCRYQVRGC